MAEFRNQINEDEGREPGMNSRPVGGVRERLSAVIGLGQKIAGFVHCFHHTRSRQAGDWPTRFHLECATYDWIARGWTGRIGVDSRGDTLEPTNRSEPVACVSTKEIGQAYSRDPFLISEENSWIEKSTHPPNAHPLSAFS